MEDYTMKKVFGIAALLLALAACNKETEITPVEQPSDSKGITITATLAPKTAVTKAVTPAHWSIRTPPPRMTRAV